MSRVISCRDLQLITGLSHLTEIEMIHPSNDALVNSYLEQLGFDLDYALEYVPNNHRDMQGNTGVGFRIIGEINLNRKHMNAVYTDTITRMAAAAYTDRSLTTELATLAGTTLDFAAFSDGGVEEDDGVFFQELIDPDWQMIASQIKALEETRDNIRGPMLNKAGTAKTTEEYQEWYSFANSNKEDRE